MMQQSEVKELQKEERIQMATKFLSHPDVIGTPQTHVNFLESKGLSITEIMESLDRVNSDKIIVANYDPIYLLPSSKYEEFLYQIYHPDAAQLLKSFHRFVNMMQKGMGNSYSLEDKSKIVVNQINLLSKETLVLYKKNKIKIAPQIVMECVEKFLM